MFVFVSSLYNLKLQRYSQSFHNCFGLQTDKGTYLPLKVKVSNCIQKKLYLVFEVKYVIVICLREKLDNSRCAHRAISAIGLATTYTSCLGSGRFEKVQNL